ncbi:MAG TPA: Uma2 family endonuclease [Blastocatellia bacterium]|nr:Uma2 family endonuclease [Blastocatellia bacterium]HMV82759.1 Uma2 family endonuclease [Blastocatellia bacterium]HMX26420.1 Uma2 family endonuclease [Blastocatellia bacterium]HMY73496.1 Uma2 family endonuclease [Blastocatellia bacterium]HMZ20287.1 Uma2 family endonuclease [Blastocatellia bacterium]
MVAVFESAAAPTKKAETWTEQKLMQLPDDGNVYELVGGELARSQAGFEHGDIAMLLGGSLSVYARERRLGRVVAAGTGFWMKTGKERLRGCRPIKKFFQGAPDLAVDIVSPNDKWQEASKKVAELFANGTKLT